jgi:hypothetical protein
MIPTGRMPVPTLGSQCGSRRFVHAAEVDRVTSFGLPKNQVHENRFDSVSQGKRKPGIWESNL